MIFRLTTGQLRTALDDIVIYQPYHYPSATATQSFTSDLRWTKVSQPTVSKMSEMFSEEGESASSGSTLRRMGNVSGYSIVALNGTSPSVIIKEASSSLKLVKVKGRSIRSIGGFHTAQCDRGIVSVDSEVSAFMCTMSNRPKPG